MIKFHRKTVIVLVILIIIIIGIALFKYLFPSRNIPIGITQLNQIVPGQTTLNQLQNLPRQFATRQEENITRIFVGQDQPRSYSTIEIHNNTVSDIVINNQILFEFSLFSGYQNKYGPPDYTLYGPGQAYGYLSYIYLKDGLIVIAHPKNRQVDEIWKIPQNLTFSQFQQKYSQFSALPQFPNRF